MKHVHFIHQCLSKICGDSNMQGLEYFGGPEITCNEGDERTQHTRILRCVGYQNGPKEETSTKIKCTKCRQRKDVNEVLVSKIKFHGYNDNIPVAVADADSA